MREGPVGPEADGGLTPGVRSDTLNTNEMNICLNLSLFGGNT